MNVICLFGGAYGMWILDGMMISSLCIILLDLDDCFADGLKERFISVVARKLIWIYNNTILENGDSFSVVCGSVIFVHRKCNDNYELAVYAMSVRGYNDILVLHDTHQSRWMVCRWTKWKTMIIMKIIRWVGMAPKYLWWYLCKTNRNNYCRW